MVWTSESVKIIRDNKSNIKNLICQNKSKSLYYYVTDKYARSDFKPKNKTRR